MDRVSSIQANMQPDSMCRVSQTELILTHFCTTPGFLLDLWKYLAKLNPKQRWIFEKICLVKLWGKEIFRPWRSNIWLPDDMVRSTKIWRHQYLYVHIIVFVGFYINPWYWKYTRTQARRQVPRPRGRRKNVAESEGGPFLLWFWDFCKSEERS